MTAQGLSLEKPTLIQSPDGNCVVRGCGRMATILRSTRRGWFLVRYCPVHERQADRLFGRETVEGW